MWKRFEPHILFLDLVFSRFKHRPLWKFTFLVFRVPKKNRCDVPLIFYDVRIKLIHSVFRTFKNLKEERLSAENQTCDIADLVSLSRRDENSIINFSDWCGDID